MRAAAVAFALLLAPVAGARAQGAPTIVLRVPDCMGTSGAAVKELIALELTPRVQVVDDAAQARLAASVRCDSSTAPVSLTVEDPSRPQPLHVELDLAAAAPLARTRLLALTLAELITTSQLERPTPVERAPAPAPEAVQAELADDDAARDAPSLQLWVAPAVSIAGDPALALLGADLGVAYALGPVSLVLDVQARLGRSERASSDVAVRSFAAGLAAMPILIDRGVQLSAGAGVRAGYVVLDATSRTANVAALQVTGVWLGPMAAAALRWPMSSTLALRFALEVGYYARPAIGLDAYGGERIALRGPWASVGVGASFGLF